MTVNKEIVNLLKDIKKQNNTIIKILRSIDIGVCEVNSYVCNDDLDEEFFGNDSDSENS